MKDIKELKVFKAPILMLLKQLAYTKEFGFFYACKKRFWDIKNLVIISHATFDTFLCFIEILLGINCSLCENVA